MTSQSRNKNVNKIVKNYRFELLSTPIPFVIFNVEPWHYYWTKNMHIKIHCTNLVYFDRHFYTINYAVNMTSILQYLSYFRQIIRFVKNQLHILMQSQTRKNCLHWYKSIDHTVANELLRRVSTLLKGLIRQKKLWKSPKSQVSTAMEKCCFFTSA